MRKKKKKRSIIKELIKFINYDTMYYDGKITSLIIVILSFLSIGLIILGCLLFN